MAQLAEVNVAEASMNRLFLIVELLMIYFLKTDMRKLVTPKVLTCGLTSTDTMRIVSLNRKEEEYIQYIVKNKKTEMCVVEMCPKSLSIKQAFFVKLAVNSQRLSISMYKDNVDPQLASLELESLVENIMANLRNDQLISKISHSYESSIIHHLKGGKDITVDEYDDELLNAKFDSREIFVQRKNEFVSILNDKDWEGQQTPLFVESPLLAPVNSKIKIHSLPSQEKFMDIKVSSESNKDHQNPTSKRTQYLRTFRTHQS